MSLAYAGLGAAPAILYRRDRPVPGGLGIVEDWIVAAGVVTLPLAGGGAAATGPQGRVMPVDEIALPGLHSRSNVLAAIAVGLLFGIAPDGIRRAVAGFTGVEHRLELVAVVDGVRYVNDSQATQPDAVIAGLRSFEAPLVLIAGGRDKGTDLTELGARRGRTRGGRHPHRRERAAARRGARGGRPSERQPCPRPCRGRAAGRRHGPRPRGRAPGHRPPEPGRGQLRPVRGLRRARPRLQGRGGGAHRTGPPVVTARPVAGPSPRRRSPAGAATPRRQLTTATLPAGGMAGLTGWLGTLIARPERGRVTTLQRDRHAPDYVLLVAIMALTAIGILMVYSSSGVRAYVSQQGDSMAVVGPQLLWACLGIVAMVVTMRIDYRWWRMVSLPFYAVAIGLLVLVLVPGFGIQVGGSARWLQIHPLPAIHPAELAKLAMVVYLAHWMANRGRRIGSIREGTIPFLLLVAPIIFLVVKEPDLGTTGVLTLTAFILFWVAGANLWQFTLLLPAGVAGVAFVIVGNAYQASRIATFLDPWKDPLGAGFHTIQGLLALGLGGVLGAGLGQSAQAGGRGGAQCLQRLHLRRHRRGVRPGGRGARGGPLPHRRLPGPPDRPQRARHVRRPAGHGGHGLAPGAGLHQHRRGREPPADHRHHAAVRERRRLVARGQLRRRRYPALHLPRDPNPRHLERCGS